MLSIGSPRPCKDESRWGRGPAPACAAKVRSRPPRRHRAASGPTSPRTEASICLPASACPPTAGTGWSGSLATPCGRRSRTTRTRPGQTGAAAPFVRRDHTSALRPGRALGVPGRVDAPAEGQPDSVSWRLGNTGGLALARGPVRDPRRDAADRGFRPRRRGAGGTPGHARPRALSLGGPDAPEPGSGCARLSPLWRATPANCGGGPPRRAGPHPGAPGAPHRSPWDPAGTRPPDRGRRPLRGRRSRLTPVASDVSIVQVRLRHVDERDRSRRS